MSLLGDDSISMESLKIVAIWIILEGLFFPLALAKVTGDGPVRIAYFNKIFGHLRRHPYANSSTLTVLDCNTSITIVNGNGRKSEQWYHVKVGIYEGYVKKNNLSFQRVECFQKKYPHFFGAIKIDPSEQYHWGKLYDRYEQARTRIR